MTDTPDLRTLIREDGSGRRWVDAFGDPRLFSELIARLAEEIAPVRAKAVCCWNDSESAVLAYALAARLGVPVVRAQADLGLMELVDPAYPPQRQRVIVAAPLWTGDQQGDVLAMFLENAGYELAAAVTLIDEADSPWPSTEVPCIVMENL